MCAASPRHLPALLAGHSRMFAPSSTCAPRPFSFSTFQHSCPNVVKSRPPPTQLYNFSTFRPKCCKIVCSCHPPLLCAPRPFNFTTFQHFAPNVVKSWVPAAPPSLPTCLFKARVPPGLWIFQHFGWLVK